MINKIGYPRRKLCFLEPQQYVLFTKSPYQVVLRAGQDRVFLIYCLSHILRDIRMVYIRSSAMSRFPGHRSLRYLQPTPAKKLSVDFVRGFSLKKAL